MSQDQQATNRSPQYNIAAIRGLLRDAFAAEELRRFCHDRPAFQAILNQFGAGFSFEDMIEVVIEQCEKQDLVAELLAAVREVNPKQFKWYQANLVGPDARVRVVNLRPLDMIHTFKDRQPEIEAVLSYLAEPSVRLVCVVGRGGIGKTALVCHLLADLEQGVRSTSSQEQSLPLRGILYLSARSTGLEFERIYSGVVRMLDERTATRLANQWTFGDNSLLCKVEALLEAMQDGLYLILLDNLEDYLTDGNEITDEGLRLFIDCCLTQPSGARLIATSRQQVRLAAAALPRMRAVLLSDGLPELEASALLYEFDPQGTLGLRKSPAAEIRRAIQMTQGIPRALEIIAGILDRDPTTTLQRVLADERLFGKEIVSQLVGQGYHGLSDAERRVMEALAVFDQPVSEAAITYLLQPRLTSLDIQACLRHLVSSYFVRCNRISGEFSLHPLDREYAYRQLPDSDETGTYTQRNLELCAASFYHDSRKPEAEWKTIEDIAPLLAEFEHRVRGSDCETAGGLLDSIDSKYLFVWGHSALLVKLRERLVGRLQDLHLASRNLGSLGRAYHALGNVTYAVTLHEEALTLARQVDDRALIGWHLRNLGNTLHSLGQSEKAVRFYQESLDIAREVGNQNEVANRLGNLALTYHATGQLDKAVELHMESLALAREIGDEVLQGLSLNGLGSTYLVMGEFGKAISLYEQALNIARRHGARWQEEINYGGLASAYNSLGQIDLSINYCQQALSIAQEIGDQRKEGGWTGLLGRNHHAVGEIVQAVDFYKRSVDIARMTGNRREEARRLSDLGSAYRDLGEIQRAIDLYREAMAISKEIRALHHEVIQLNRLGFVAETMGQAEQATKFHLRGLQIAREIHSPLRQSFCLLGLGRAHLTQSQVPEAIEYLAEALALDIPETRHRAALALGIGYLYQDRPVARGMFTQAIGWCQEILAKSARLYAPRFTLAASIIGKACCDSGWSETESRTHLMASAMAEYRQALECCATAGVAQDAICDLQLFQAAGIKGLEPVFELLQPLAIKGGRGYE